MVVRHTSTLRAPSPSRRFSFSPFTASELIPRSLKLARISRRARRSRSARPVFTPRERPPPLEGTLFLGSCEKRRRIGRVVFIGYGALNVVRDREIGRLYPDLFLRVGWQKRIRREADEKRKGWKGGREHTLERLFGTVKIENGGPMTENEKLRPPYRPSSCCLAALVRSPSPFALSSDIFIGRSTLRCIPRWLPIVKVDFPSRQQMRGKQTRIYNASFTKRRGGIERRLTRIRYEELLDARFIPGLSFRNIGNVISVRESMLLLVRAS